MGEAHSGRQQPRRIRRAALRAAMLVLGATCAAGCGDGARPAPTPTISPSATTSSTATASVTASHSSTSTPQPPPSETPTPPGPSPTSTASALCAARVGGALIRFAICDETLTVWSTAPGFIDEALALLAAGEQRIPVFGTLSDGADCDRRWTWHPDPAAMSFTDLAIELCDGCPSHIENDKAYWLGTVGEYCPWSAKVTAVDDHRPVR